MARPPTITNEQILDAARSVFLEKGIRATTAEVARRAQVAEGSIFNRFKTKEELFCAAMHFSRNGEPPWFATLTELAQAEDIEASLFQLGSEILEFFRKVMPLMMMAWSNAGTLPSALTEPNPLPLRALKAIACFFEGQMRAGRIDRQDPEILARVFLGSLHNYVFFEIVFQAQEQLPLPESTFLRGLARLLWRGMSPAQAGRAGSPARETEAEPRRHGRTRATSARRSRQKRRRPPREGPRDETPE